MSSKAKPPRLGRGLSALMPATLSRPVEVNPPAGDASSAVLEVPPTAPVHATDDGVANRSQGEGVRLLALAEITPNPYQPRKHFDEGALAQLAQSIQQTGLMQPVVVRVTPGTGSKGYELIVGERRWRAAKLAGLEQIPALVRELTDHQIAEWALVENLQREDLNPIERAEAFQKLADRFQLTHEQIAQRVGVERPTITNALRLLSLDPAVQDLIRTDRLSAGHARALVSVSDPDLQRQLANQVVREDWSVRQTEQAIRKLQQSPGTAVVMPKTRDVHLADLAQQMTRQLGMKVQIRAGRKKGAGQLSLAFSSHEQFEHLLSRLGVKIDEES